MPRPKREGNWEAITMTLSGEVRAQLRQDAVDRGWEIGKTADALLRVGLEFRRAPVDFVQTEFLRALFRCFSLNHNRDEFLEWLGGEVHRPKGAVVSGREARLEGALELIYWQRAGSVPTRWRKPVCEWVEGCKLNTLASVWRLMPREEFLGLK
jgi:hypothetical protein